MDDGWQAVEVEPETAAVDVNGGGDAIGDSHEDEAPGQLQSLFSWTEFLAGEQGVRRSRKPKPASTSLFEWALGMEREREEEPVGAGRRAA